MAEVIESWVDQLLINPRRCHFPSHFPSLFPAPFYLSLTYSPLTFLLSPISLPNHLSRICLPTSLPPSLPPNLPPILFISYCFFFIHFPPTHQLFSRLWLCDIFTTSLRSQWLNSRKVPKTSGPACPVQHPLPPNIKWIFCQVVA